LNLKRAVRNADLAADFVAQVGQLPANPLLVRIEHAAEEQLGAGVDQFDVQGITRS
jgi:hypothetical protein